MSGARIAPQLDPRAISPELVLVDPELAGVAKAELCAQAEQQLARPASPTPEPESSRAVGEDAEPARNRNARALAARVSSALGAIFTAVLAVSILLNLAFVGALFALGNRPTLASPGPVTPLVGQVPQPQRTTQTPTVTKTAPSPPPTPPRRSGTTKAKAERGIVAFVLSTPSSRLPSALTDSQTGLLKNNVHVVCRRPSRGRARTFLCVVRPPGAATGSGLYIRYRVVPRGRPELTWLGFRKG